MLLFRTNCRKPHAMRHWRFFRMIAGILHRSDDRTRAAEFAAPAGPARLFVLPVTEGSVKNSTKSRGAHLARPLRQVLADHYRIALSASVSDIQNDICCEPPGFAGQG
jgi:hypothetical protein